MRLNRYKSLRYRVNDVSQLFPALFVSNFPFVGQDYFSEETYKRTGYGDKKCKAIGYASRVLKVRNLHLITLFQKKVLFEKC